MKVKMTVALFVRTVRKATIKYKIKNIWTWVSPFFLRAFTAINLKKPVWSRNIDMPDNEMNITSINSGFMLESVNLLWNILKGTALVKRRVTPEKNGTNQYKCSLNFFMCTFKLNIMQMIVLMQETTRADTAKLFIIFNCTLKKDWIPYQNIHKPTN